MAEEMKKQESVGTINAPDGKEPTALIPDSEIKETMARICKDDDVKEVLFEAVQKHKKQKEKLFDHPVVKFLLFPLAIVIISIVVNQCLL